jgi:hypothetical protein
MDTCKSKKAKLVRTFRLPIVLGILFFVLGMQSLSAQEVYIQSATITSTQPATYSPITPPKLTGTISVINTTNVKINYFIVVQEALDQRYALLTVNEVSDTLGVTVLNSGNKEILPIESIPTVTTNNSIMGSINKNATATLTFYIQSASGDYGMGGLYQGTVTFDCYKGTTIANKVYQNTYPIAFSFNLPIYAEMSLDSTQFDFFELQQGESLSTNLHFTATRGFDLFVKSTNNFVLKHLTAPENEVPYVATLDGASLNAISPTTPCLTITSEQLPNISYITPALAVTVGAIPEYSEAGDYRDQLMFTILTR